MRPLVRAVGLGVALLCVAWGEGRAQEVDVATWLTGCWLASSGSIEIEEVWLPPKGGIMLGVSRTVRGEVAVGYELLRLHSVDGRLVLSAYPSGQAPADFAASEASSRRLRFENPSHDSPQVIEYVREGPDSLVARVFGDVAAATPSFVSAYGRATCDQVRSPTGAAWSGAS